MGEHLNRRETLDLATRDQVAADRTLAPLTRGGKGNGHLLTAGFGPGTPVMNAANRGINAIETAHEDA